jgi:hypothetical protein
MKNKTLKRVMNATIGLFTLCSFSAFAGYAFAGEFRKTLFISGIFNPDQPSLQALSDRCTAEALSIDQRLSAIAATKGGVLSDVRAVPQIETITAFEGMAYSCNVLISGKSDQSVELVSLSERVDHLKKKGYKKSEYSKACDKISKAYALNPYELRQQRKVSFSLLNGHYCAVSSEVVIFNP